MVSRLRHHSLIDLIPLLVAVIHQLLLIVCKSLLQRCLLHVGLADGLSVG